MSSVLTPDVGFIADWLSVEELFSWVLFDGNPRRFRIISSSPEYCILISSWRSSSAVNSRAGLGANEEFLCSVAAGGNAETSVDVAVFEASLVIMTVAPKFKNARVPQIKTIVEAMKVLRALPLPQYMYRSCRRIRRIVCRHLIKNATKEADKHMA